jgi:hypothetical protein
MQKTPKILNYKNLAFEKYEYGQPFKHPNGTYHAPCNYRLSKNEIIPFYFETPKLRTTSGIVKLENKYYMDLELSQSTDASAFYNFILKLDEHNITMCHKNSKEWFNQYMPLDIVETYYKSSIILRPSGQLPILRVRLPSYKSNIITEIYNLRKEKVNDILCIQADDYVVGILEFSGLSFMSQSFYPVFELQKIKIFKDNEYRSLPSGYIFSDINEKIDLNKATTPSDEERILTEKPSKNTIIITDLKREEMTQSKIDIKEPLRKDSKPSLFNMIKSSSLATLLADDDLFNSNSSSFKMAREAQRQQQLARIEQIKKIQEQIKQQHTDINQNISLKKNMDSKIDNAINIEKQARIQDVSNQDVSNQDVEKEYNEEFTIDEDNQENYDNNDADLNDTNLNDTNLNENEDGTSDTESSTDGIDYQVLDELEVVVFDD